VVLVMLLAIFFTTFRVYIYRQYIYKLNLAINTLKHRIDLFVVTATDCLNPLDLVFLVDDSSSIRENEWPRVLSFLQDVVRRFTIGRENTRIGLVRYATRADVMYRLTSTQSENAVNSAIGRMRHEGGSTNLAAAMREAYQNVFLPAMRAGAAKVA